MTPLTRIRSFATGMILLEWTYFVEAENVNYDDSRLCKSENRLLF